MAGIITTESMVAGATGLRMAASANMAAANMPAGMAAADTAKSPDKTTRMILVPREASVRSAIFAATGKRIRELPLSRTKLGTS